MDNPNPVRFKRIYKNNETLWTLWTLVLRLLNEWMNELKVCLKKGVQFN